MPQLSVVAHATDVNVISWSAQSTFMLASGGDDGALRVWDLRMFGRDAAANEGSFVANFTYHRNDAAFMLFACIFALPCRCLLAEQTNAGIDQGSHHFLAFVMLGP